MRKSFFTGILIGIVIASVVTMGISLVANQPEGKKPEYTTLVWGKLKLKPTGEPEVAEKLLTEKLIPAAKEIQGLKIAALKWTSIPGQEAQKKPSQPDYVMMAEMADVNVFFQLMTSHSADLEEYGERMKVQAGKPEFELYQILSESTE